MLPYVVPRYGCGLASSPRDTNNRKFGSQHPGVTQFVMCDGHVEALTNDTDVDVLLSTLLLEMVIIHLILMKATEHDVEFLFTFP